MYLQLMLLHVQNIPWNVYKICPVSGMCDLDVVTVSVNPLLLTDLSVYVWLSSALRPCCTSAARFCHNRQVVRRREWCYRRTLWSVCSFYWSICDLTSATALLFFTLMWSFYVSLYSHCGQWGFVLIMITISVTDTVISCFWIYQLMNCVVLNL